MSCFQAIS